MSEPPDRAAPAGLLPAAGSDPRSSRRPRSLHSRALALLARREHSRVELARKLAPYAASVAELDALLDDLQVRRLLSDARFVEVLARSRSQRFGAARIRQELRARGVSDDLSRAALSDLCGTEMQRARELWVRRYGEPAASPAERARQMRFLAARGFDPEVIRKVVGGSED